MIHDNSLMAFRKCDKSYRRHIIYRIYETEGKPLTDRFIAEKLEATDMNFVRPRITEMIKDELLKQCGNEKDDTTHRTVRIVRIRTAEDNLQQELF